MTTKEVPNYENDTARQNHGGHHLRPDGEASCNGCSVNWNGGNNPNSTGQISNVTGFNKAEVILDTQETYSGPLFNGGCFNIALAPPPAQKPGSATLYAVKTTSAGDTLRKLLITNKMIVNP